MLQRVLEPEAMDSFEEAQDYDAMDHGEVNRRFVDDLLAAAPEPGDVLDLGTGTAQIPIALCQRTDGCRVMAVDMAVHMLDTARLNIEIEGLIERIFLGQADAKQLPHANAMFDTVMSNSIVHHVPDPAPVLQEALRVVRPGGLLFFRDLARPESEEQLAHLVETYAGEENEHQQKMFADSLRAALSVEEIQAIVEQFGFSGDSIAMTSDRHWTWSARRPAD